MTKQVPHWIEETLCVWKDVVSQNLGTYDYFLVKKSLAVISIFLRCYQESPYTLQLMSMQVMLQLGLVAAYRLPGCAIERSHCSYLSDKWSWLCPTIPVFWIYQASSALAENSPSDAFPFWRLCQPHSWVHHLRSACPALYLHHLPHVQHSPHHQDLQDCSSCLKLLSASSQMFLEGCWLSILHFQHFSYLPGLA